MNVLELENISKSFGNNQVLNNLSITISPGEFVTFLGPSGCGKTTMLKIIAGLEQADSGRVILKGEDITQLPPEKRTLNTVFQNYALFPHMNVEKNIEYGLKIKGVKKAERKKLVKEILDIVKLSGYEKRNVNDLSGGEKQRVAIARAAVNKPSVLLLDEPLAALDLQLRKHLQNELKSLQKKLNMTFIYITHDQEEAMNMSDRIFVMNNGQIEQSGTPSEIYDSPKTRFIATFVGAANIIDGKVLEISDECVKIIIGNDVFSLPYSPDYQQGKISLAIRSENISISSIKTENSLMATVIDKAYVNGLFRTKLRLVNHNEIMSTAYSINEDININDTVYVSINPNKVIYIPEAEHEK